MRIGILLAVIAAMGILVTGCGVAASGPIVAPLTLDQQGPVAVGDVNASPTLEGRATAQGFVVFSMGDASIKAAMEDGGITRIHHVDSEMVNILGLYSKYTTIVYGE